MEILSPAGYYPAGGNEWRKDMGKRIILLIIFCIIIPQAAFLHGQNNVDENALEEEPQSSTPFETAMKIWLEDSRTLQPIVNPLRKYKEDFNDTDIARDEKKRLLAKTIVEVNKKYANKQLDLGCVRAVDVKEDKVLSSYGRQKARKIINELKKHPDGKFVLEMGADLEKNFLLLLYVGLALAFCDKCYTPTGKYIAKYEIPVPSRYSNKIYDGFSEGIYIGDVEKVKLNNSENDFFGNNVCKVSINKKLRNKEKALSIPKKSISSLKGTIEKIVYRSSSDEVVIYLK